MGLKNLGNHHIVMLFFSLLKTENDRERRRDSLRFFARGQAAKDRESTCRELMFDMSKSTCHSSGLRATVRARICPCLFVSSLSRYVVSAMDTLLVSDLFFEDTTRGSPAQ